MSEHVEERDGVYYVPGTRISLDSIVYAFRDGSTPQSIREDFEGLTLSHVYGAISFYLDNQAEMDAYLLMRKEQWAELEHQGIPPGADLLARIERARLERANRAAAVPRR